MKLFLYDQPNEDWGPTMKKKKKMVNPRMGIVCELPALDYEIVEVLEQNAKGLVELHMSLWSALHEIWTQLRWWDKLNGVIIRVNWGIYLLHLLFRNSSKCEFIMSYSRTVQTIKISLKNDRVDEECHFEIRLNGEFVISRVRALSANA